MAIQKLPVRAQFIDNTVIKFKIENKFAANHNFRQ